MKIVLNSSSNDFANTIISHVLENYKGIEIVSTKSERPLKDQIGYDNTDAYVLEANKSWTQKSIDFIKKKNPHIPVIVLFTEEISEEWPRGAEFYLFNPDYSISPIHIFESIYRSVSSYGVNFQKLQNLTSNLKDEIAFDDFQYDPVRREFRYGGKLIKKMSPKEGGVLEILASNFDNIVKKDIIMEKVWHHVDFYIGRSMDVYITNLRNLFKKNELPLSIKNIHNVGLIMEYDR